METRFLLAYATVSGATLEIAEAVAQTLREQGLTVDVLPARKVQTLAGYSAVVLGAPLYMFHIHKDARRFLAQHQKALAGGLPIAIFADGPFGDTDAKGWEMIRSKLDAELAALTWLKPAAVEVMGGKFDPANLKFPYNLIPAMRGMPPSDLRDWDAIRAWAGRLPALLKGA